MFRDLFVSIIIQMKTDMHMDVTPPEFCGRLQSAKAEEIVADQLMKAVDGVTDAALDDVAVEQCQVARPASGTAEARSEHVHIEAVRMLLKQVSQAWAYFYF